MPLIEHHFIHRSNWLRASVLGANDGIVSTTSLLVGLASANASQETLLLTGVAATVAGALSMAAGEYVSVSSQSNIESADLEREYQAILNNHDTELDELAKIYQSRGLTQPLAKEVAKQLMTHNALEAHARDELGISHVTDTRPFQAAWTSALAFCAGSLLPLLTLLIALDNRAVWLALASLSALAILGYVTGRTGGTSLFKPIARIVSWGIIAMGTTAAVGSWFDVAM